MNDKTDLGQAWTEFIIELSKALKIDLFAKWLKSKLEELNNE